MPGPRFRLFRLMPSRPDRVAEEVNDEIRFHLDARAEQLQRQGFSPEDARAEAARRFGSLDEARQRLHRSATHRENVMRMHEQLEALVHDLRYAARGLRRQPGFTAAVVLTLALGIGANATMFGITDRLLLRAPSGLVAPGETGRIYLMRTFDGNTEPNAHMQYRRYLDLRENTRSFSELAAVSNSALVLGTAENAKEAEVGMVSASFWPLFGTRPLLGRFFTEAEDRAPTGTHVAVLSYGYWRSQFGGDTNVLGKSVFIGSSQYMVIGVAPRGFSGTSMAAVAAFIPIVAAGHDEFGDWPASRGAWYDSYNLSWVQLIGRRKPGLTNEAIDADLTSAFVRSFERHDAVRTSPGPSIRDIKPRGVFASIVSDRGPNRSQNAKVATWLVGVSALVLLMACANVANLLLARALRRRREIAVRIALGVSRGRLLRQLLSESMLLALIGGGAGILVAHWGGGVLRKLLLPDVEWTSTVFDSRVLLFSGAMALLAGLLTGIVPAVQLSRSDVAATLKAGGREGSVHRSRLRASLLVLQGAISVVLLIGAGLFVRSLHNVRTLDLGFDAERVAFVALAMRGTVVDSARKHMLLDELTERARDLPMVEDAAITHMVPFWMTWSESVYSPGVDSTRLRGEFYMNSVSPEYFRTMGTQILRGRGFTSADRAGGVPVAIVSANAAHTIWPGQDPLGKCVKYGSDTTPCLTVIGVAEDIRRGFEEGPGRHVYFSAAQNMSPNMAGLFVRTRGEARKQIEPVRRELQRLMPGSGFVNARSLQDIVDPNVRPWRLGATMFTLFGVLALFVAALGLYSVIAYDVAQRTHELGVRVALGASSRHILRLVVGSGVRVTVVGMVLGAGVAAFAGKYIKPLLYEISPSDPLTFTGVLLALLIVAVAASLVPGLRATKVDPNVALRAD